MAQDSGHVTRSRSHQSYHPSVNIRSETFRSPETYILVLATASPVFSTALGSGSGSSLLVSGPERRAMWEHEEILTAPGTLIDTQGFDIIRKTGKRGRLKIDR